MNQPERVYFFGTCLIDLLYPKAGLAGMALIEREGVKVIYPANQGCCGQPAFNSGYRQEALAVARAQLNCFPKEYPIVVPSGSCAGMVKHHWPELFAGEPDESQAIAAAERTYELTEFLVDVLALQLNDLGQPTKIAIH
ncbi:MAG: (Fe-S)-binding protein, partial [Candidatus Thiodiazotropha taylori]